MVITKGGQQVEMSLVTMIIDGPRILGPSVTNAIMTESMTKGITTTDGRTNLPTTIEEGITDDTNRGPFIKDLAGRREPDLTTTIVPIPALFIRAATVDEATLKTFTDAVMKVDDAMMTIEGHTATSTRPNADTRCIVHMGLLVMACGAAPMSVQEVQALADFMIIGPAKSFAALVTSSTLPHRVVVIIK